jgi:hypothetical protein
VREREALGRWRGARLRAVPDERVLEATAVLDYDNGNDDDDNDNLKDNLGYGIFSSSCLTSF